MADQDILHRKSGDIVSSPEIDNDNHGAKYQRGDVEMINAEDRQDAPDSPQNGPESGAEEENAASQSNGQDATEQ